MLLETIVFTIILYLVYQLCYSTIHNFKKYCLIVQYVDDIPNLYIYPINMLTNDILIAKNIQITHFNRLTYDNNKIVTMDRNYLTRINFSGATINFNILNKYNIKKILFAYDKPKMARKIRLY
jgi:hypothetical protein